MKRLLLLTSVLAFGLPAAAALAEEVEITPFAGYRFDGDFDRLEDRRFLDNELEESSSFGVIADFGITRSLMLELLASRQSTTLIERNGFFEENLRILDLDVDYYHLGLLWQWRPGQVQPFLVASLGATRFDPEGDFTTETRFSVSLGGGVKVFFADGFGLRLEGRLFSTLIDRDEEIFCGRRECFTFSESAYVTQGEVLGGLIFRF